jgi:hypothetical protein
LVDPVDASGSIPMTKGDSRSVAVTVTFSGPALGREGDADGQSLSGANRILGS